MSTPSNITASDSVTAAVSLGSNLEYLGWSSTEIVLEAMERLRQISIESKSSSLYRSAPIDCPPGVGDFINAAMLLELPATISPRDLLSLMQGIENALGRERGSQRNQARSIDLDIISYENQQLESPDLILPHPRAGERGFVLMPLAEIEPELILPGQSAGIATLLAALPSTGDVHKLS